jgi:hypothetical protein
MKYHLCPPHQGSIDEDRCGPETSVYSPFKHRTRFLALIYFITLSFLQCILSLVFRLMVYWFILLEIELEGNADKTKYMVMSRDQNAGRNHSIKTDNSSFERVEDFKYLETTLTKSQY